MTMTRSGIGKIKMCDFLSRVRGQAGTPRGIAFAKRLDAMSPADAADEIKEMIKPG
jgi:hypothetical protein